MVGSGIVTMEQNLLSRFSATKNASKLVKGLKYGVCRVMLEKSIGHTSISYWNIALVVPNAVCLLFLAYNLRLLFRLLPNRKYPVVKTLFVLVCFVCCVNIMRGFIASIVQPNAQYRNAINEGLWLLLRFLALAVEISVIGFALFGNNEGDGVGKRVLSLSFYLALVYTTIQLSLEVFKSNRDEIFKDKYTMFDHGGMIFWFVTSCMFVVVYSSLVILSQTKCCCPEKLGFLCRPSNRAFYYYAAILCVVNLAEAIGSLMVYHRITLGLCILNVAVLIFYSLFAPFIYFVFLQNSFSLLKFPETNINSRYASYSIMSEDPSSSSERSADFAKIIS
ncbi:transmembrane protein adipocyte-associated 1-like [Xenia sp. Carnegie-2017]|uniref:transmembrane protein adipocyte-associated 1-like n=1 Tax=Xenia sp. Carnegie-2017 TaxID=2897299 RepID=UPI001F042CA4|nr:transmembrane protein adipocyte-associated 1-like [Xenia sp. Carnegie-2017]XP_046839854.1 transmembrane protein adipocyte-associated 1-like [Xenia sp. Carnegie-2017]